MAAEGSNRTEMDIDKDNKIKFQNSPATQKGNLPGLSIIIFAFLLLMLYQQIRENPDYDLKIWLIFWVISIIISLSLQVLIKYFNRNRFKKLPFLILTSTLRWVLIFIIISLVIIYTVLNTYESILVSILVMTCANQFLVLIIGMRLWDVESEIILFNGRLEGYYLETFYLLPFKIVKKMQFLPDDDGNFQLLIYTSTRALGNNRNKLLNFFYGEDEFIKESGNKKFIVAMFDVKRNPEIKSAVILISYTQQEIIHFLELLRSFGNVKVVKIKPTEIGIKILNNKYYIKTEDKIQVI